jgi:Na+/melibiose symporter-like transporter
MATGLAIMGFGGGAMIGSPLALYLMQRFSSPHSVGAVQAMTIMGVLYFLFMMFGVFSIRIPAPGWKPLGWTPQIKSSAMITTRNATVATAIRTPQFYLLWLVLCLNTTAGIGILEQASPMIREMFPRKVLAPAAAGFVGLLSLFNMAGRFFWSSTSDYIGRKATYATFFLLGVVLYSVVPTTGSQHVGSVALFVLVCGILLSMYGGGFSAMPAYVRDLFGARDLSQIYGRILTAWSVAGILGPMLVNYVRKYQLDRGVPPANAYSTVLYVMSALLGVGLICNFFIRKLSDEKYEAEESMTRQLATGV